MKSSSTSVSYFWTGLPFLLILVIPVLSWSFFGFAARSLDEECQAEMVKAIATTKGLSAQARREASQFVYAHPASEILASSDPALQDMKQQLSGLTGVYWRYGALRTIAGACIALALGTLAFGLLAVALSFRSHSIQYMSIAVFWQVLRIVAFLELVGQGLLALAMSFYFTAVLGHVYYPKLIAIASVFVIAPVLWVMASLFKRIDVVARVQGELLEASRAVALRTRIDDLARALDTEPPHHLVVGIDDNFFVTEHDVEVVRPTDGVATRCKGRTLFISLPLLKTLEHEEAEAVLAHEMSHFSGQDTLYSRRLAPILARYDQYLQSLHENPFAWPIWLYALAFRNLFELSLSHTGRQRELRADADAARLTRPSALAHALLKITAFSRYRASLEEELFSRRETLDAPRISAGIASGFPAFVGAGVSLESLGEAETPHPFDSHPPLQQRMAAVGVHLQPQLRESVLLSDVSASWHATIENVDTTETTMWAAYERDFQQAHDVALAYRYLPANQEELGFVERHFPRRRFTTPKGVSIDLTCLGLEISVSKTPIQFADFVSATVDDSAQRTLSITYRRKGVDQELTAEIDLTALDESFTEVFNEYWKRAQIARQQASAH